MTIDDLEANQEARKIICKSMFRAASETDDARVKAEIERRARNYARKWKIET